MTHTGSKCPNSSRAKDCGIATSDSEAGEEIDAPVADGSSLNMFGLSLVILYCLGFHVTYINERVAVCYITQRSYLTLLI